MAAVGPVFAITIICVVLVSFVAQSFFIIGAYKKCPPGYAIVRKGFGGSIVSFSGMIVVPFLQQSHKIAVSSRNLDYTRSGDSALRFQCGTLVNLHATLRLSVGKETETILLAVDTLGVETINDDGLLRTYFSSEFNDCLDSLAGQTDFIGFSQEKDLFRDRVLDKLGHSISQMVIDGVYIHHLDPQ